jgi:glucose-6-phosphate 1-dehydrogenase
VQVTAAETVGVGSRAANFYDTSGAMRDMIQSHLLQVMAIVAMEPPSSYVAEAFSRERIKLFKSIRPIPVEEAHQHAAFGRYAAEAKEPAYVGEKGVDPSRRTDTFAAMRVHVDNWRWSGTPFYLRSGKKLARKLTEIVIQFKQPPAWLFRGVAERPANRVVINIAPDEGISIRLEAKVPGPKLLIDSVKLDMDYSATFKSKAVEAYGPLLLDAMRGDRMLYKHREEVEGAWTVCQPLLDSKQIRKDIQEYLPGSWGPSNADDLLARDGRIWHNPIAAEKR